MYCHIGRILERLPHQKIDKFNLDRQLTGSLAVTIRGVFVDRVGGVWSKYINRDHTDPCSVFWFSTVFYLT